ncbi:MAG: hypothetical protein AYP45_08425 [Candidatus Brocadia carolinensis]|uniref:Macrocin O-methyltransferase n=1 Tax=Candidatus Brocadia carolinensis TaxID=1004156 RepID=A0A1V4ATV2_9BACT|nr:MAG: hypothetical protein AYP45_08425 [Candidatus Brocadia caroliniensis]
MKSIRWPFVTLRRMAQECSRLKQKHTQDITQLKQEYDQDLAQLRREYAWIEQERARLIRLHLQLLQDCLCGIIYEDPPLKTLAVEKFDAKLREYGWDWPSFAHTMIGRKRLANLCALVESVLGEGIEGDLIETGVWRGGACILMRGVLDAYCVKDRNVWLADSFEGCPQPNSEKYPADADDKFYTYPELSVSIEEVKRNFEKYGLLDDQVKFLKGWFKDTLPNAPIEKLAVLRLDGDLYESTMDVLVALYDKLSEGGYVIIDDYHVVEGCKKAVNDFLIHRGEIPEKKEIDGVGVYWRKFSPTQGAVPALFLHIQKTAGTSIVTAVRQHYGHSMTSYEDCWGHQPDEFTNVKFVSGHIGYDYAKTLFPGRFSFTFLRNPIERILSMYFFCRGRDPHKFVIYERANRLDLEDFLAAGFSDPWVKKNIWNNQVWQLAHGYAHLDNRAIDDFSGQQLLDLAMGHLGKFSYIGFTETVDTDCANIFLHLKLPPTVALPVVNATAGKLLVQDISKKAQELLSELTVLDWQLYEYARNRYSKRVQPG